MSDGMQMMIAKCLVCNARNAKQHYGSWCCNGCKGFFWRTISSKRRYICLRKCINELAKCEIEDGRRNSCRACRLKRCIEVGMDPNLIRDSWGKSTKQRNEQQSPGQTNLEMEQNTAAGNQQEMKSEGKNTPERHWEENHRSGLLSNCANQNNIQLLADYLEWIQTIPELKLFSEHDKNFLIANRARASGWLLLANQLLNHHVREQLGMDKMEMLEREIVGPLRELEVTKLEMELLRLICFFSSVPQLSADGKKMVQVIQGTYTRSLSEFSLKQSLNMYMGSLANMAFRNNRIVHMLANVEKIAHQYD